MTQIYTLQLELQWFHDQKQGREEDNEIKLNPDP